MSALGVPREVSARELVPLLDVTSLSPFESPEEIRALVRRAACPAPGLPPAAAVCVYPAWAYLASPLCRVNGVRLAVVAGAFPHARGSERTMVDEVAQVSAMGVDEIDIVLDHTALRAGDPRAGRVLRRQVNAAGSTPVKVIVESGVLTPPQLRAATVLAVDAGARFVKTSTGKNVQGATLDAVAEIAKTLVALDAHDVGIKVSGGVRTAVQAREFVTLVEGIRGAAVTPDIFRLGASVLLDELATEHAQALAR